MTGNSNNHAESTVTSLIREAQRADHDAWCRLTELYGPLVYHWCRRLGLSDTVAADVFQEVFLVVARRLPDFDVTRKHGSFRAWLWTITRSRAMDYWRSHNHREHAVGGTEARIQLAELPDPFGPESQDPSDRTEHQGYLHRALKLIEAEFESDTWQAFWRTTVDQQRAPDVADELGMTPAAVRQAKSRVLRRIRRFLEE